jgi:hypothetical protein
MKIPTFAEWLVMREDGMDPDSGAQPGAVPDVKMATQAVKTKLSNIDPKKPVAHQARKALASVAASAQNPMAVAQMDNPAPDPTDPAKTTGQA